MNLRFLYLVLACILLVWHKPVFAQHTEAQKQQATKVKKDIPFLVRKADKAKNIAGRYHVAFRTLGALNPALRKRQLMYAGKKLIIPVWLKKTRDSRSSDFNLADYELDMDSLDIYVPEDFVNVASIEADTIRRIYIGKEIKKLDKQILALNFMLDSTEEDGRINLSNRDIRKMPMERARRVGRFKAGIQIDSLNEQKKRISEERGKINIRVADYEYLVENAPYMATHTEGRNKKTIEIIEVPNNKPVSKKNKK
jgi:hypothetical protein